MPFSPNGEKVPEGRMRGDKQIMTSTATILARSLRRRETEAEHKLWLRLRDRRLGGHKFVRQLPVGPYFGDFACRDAKLIVELDGGQHAESRHDGHRDGFLNDQGFAVLRFWNPEVFSVIESVCETILAAIDGRLEPYDRYTQPLIRPVGHLLPGGEKGMAEHDADNPDVTVSRPAGEGSTVACKDLP